MRQVELIPIEKIVIRKRRRQDLGDLLSLANSMKKYTMLEPIAVDRDDILVFGHRRLEAAKLNGWDVIEALRWEHLTFEERLAIELEENKERKEFTPAELSMRVVEKVDRAADVIEQEKYDKSLNSAIVAEIKEEPTTEPKKEGKGGKRQGSGRKPQGRVSRKVIAEKLGIGETTIRRADDHVAILQKYPELSNPLLTQQDALTMGKSLDTMHPEQRDQARILLQKGDSDTMLHLAGKKTNKDVIVNGGQGLTLKSEKPKRVSGIENYETFCHMKERWEIFAGEIEKVGGIEAMTERWSEPMRMMVVRDITEIYEKAKVMYEDAKRIQSTIDV